ncbi:hypothetical protein [Nocardia fluminea]|uniref:hypothetical protein n=1 Tax=Nocardia fluminea TaxID=134984 RepID=UPI003D117D3E
MAFTVFTADTDADKPLQFEDEDSFWYEPGGVLVIKSKTFGIRYYAPGQWQELHYLSHPEMNRPATVIRR